MRDANDVQRQVDQWVREHGRQAERYLRSRVDAASSHDAYQEVWQAVQAGLSGLKSPSRPLVWILGIARNKVLDAHQVPAMEELGSELSRPGPLGSLLGLRRPTTPISAALEHERKEALRAALSRLSPEDRELLDLRFVAGLKPAEIAEVLGEAPNTISQRIVRAARRLRQELMKDALFASSEG